MDNPAKFLAHAKHGSKPGVRIFQREPGDHQHRKRKHQDEMLPALIARQPEHRAMLRLASRDRLTPPDDRVVQEHAPNHQQDHRDVEARHKPHHNAPYARRLLGIQVDLAQGESLGHSLVTLSAGCNQIGAINSRTRIARRQNVVHPMATGAVGHNHGTIL